jgi:hypothetical protein
MFEFILFVLLGLCVFVPLSERAKTVALVVYVVLMVLWLVAGATGYNPGAHFGFNR